MPTVAEKRRTLRALHASGCFVIPNPWDVGSARYLQHLGFKALASTSSGAAWSLGFADGELPLGPMLDHLRALVAATDVPINADFLAGFADSPEGVGESVRRCVDTGVAGLSIEDEITGTNTLYSLDVAVERVRAARGAIDATGGEVLLVARTECFLTGYSEPLKEAKRRLTAFAEAGADCLYAPGVATPEDIAAIVKTVAPKPINVLARGLGGLTVAALADLGVRRISVGGALARTAWAGFQDAVQEIVEHGTFGAFDRAASGAALNAFFARGEKR